MNMRCLGLAALLLAALGTVAAAQSPYFRNHQSRVTPAGFLQRLGGGHAAGCTDGCTTPPPCGCEAPPPACGCESGCTAPPACGCESSCGHRCGSPLVDLLNHIFPCHSCGSGGCSDAPPACGCEAGCEKPVGCTSTPACGCETGHRGLLPLFRPRRSCSPAPPCGCVGGAPVGASSAPFQMLEPPPQPMPEEGLNDDSVNGVDAQPPRWPPTPTHPATMRGAGLRRLVPAPAVPQPRILRDKTASRTLIDPAVLKVSHQTPAAETAELEVAPQPAALPQMNSRPLGARWSSNLFEADEATRR